MRRIERIGNSRLIACQHEIRRRRQRNFKLPRGHRLQERQFVPGQLPRLAQFRPHRVAELASTPAGTLPVQHDLLGQSHPPHRPCPWPRAAAHLAIAQYVEPDVACFLNGFPDSEILQPIATRWQAAGLLRARRGRATVQGVAAGCRSARRGILFSYALSSVSGPRRPSLV